MASPDGATEPICSPPDDQANLVHDGGAHPPSPEAPWLTEFPVVVSSLGAWPWCCGRGPRERWRLPNRATALPAVGVVQAPEQAASMAHAAWPPGAMPSTSPTPTTTASSSSRA